MIRGIIEDGKSEFKQTWQLPTGGEKKEQWEETKKGFSRPGNATWYLTY